MPASVSDSYRNNEIATPTFMTPFGVPFFSWSEDGEYVKRSMEELRPMYEAWEKHIEGEYLPSSLYTSDVDADWSVVLQRSGPRPRK